MPTPPLSEQAMQEAVDAVARNAGSRTAAALELGLHRKTLSDRYHAGLAQGIKAPPREGPSHASPSLPEPAPTERLGGGRRGDGIRFCVASDSHGDAQDDAAVEAFLGFVDSYRPTIRVHAGDVWDFRGLRGNASKEELEEEILPDFKAGLRFLRRYKPQILTRGNHDERLWDHAARKGIIPEFCRKVLIPRIEKTLDKIGTRMLPYHVRHGYWLGDVHVSHGFACGVGATAQQARTFGRSIFGHTHAIERVTVPGYPTSKTAFNIGCLCNLDMAYSSKRLTSLRQSHGFAYGTILPSGETVVHLAEIKDGKVIE
jgi:predicted phosphodiesterase